MFNDIKFQNMDACFGPDAIRSLIEFPNGYKASVIRHIGSYGGSSGLFEVAVMSSSHEILYDTPVTDDVKGWLTPGEVEDTLAQIESLPPR